MKKFLIVLILSIFSFNLTSAEWRVDNDYIYIEPWIITKCSWDNLQVWNITWTWIILSETNINSVCWTNNWLTVVLSWTAKWSINEAWYISTSNIGVIAITILWFTLFIMLLGMIYKAFNKNKSKWNQKSFKWTTIRINNIVWAQIRKGVWMKKFNSK